MSTIYLKTSYDIQREIAKKFKELRKQKGITQKRLSQISMVPYGSIKRFEQTGEISFNSLIELSMAINELNWLDDVFNKKPYTSIKEIMNEK